MTDSKACNACGHANESSATHCAECNAPLDANVETFARTMAIDMSNIAALDAFQTDGDGAAPSEVDTEDGAVEAADSLDAPQSSEMLSTSESGPPEMSSPSEPEVAPAPAPAPMPVNSAAPSDDGPSMAAPPDAPDRTMLYIGIGVGALVLVCCCLSGVIAIPSLGGGVAWLGLSSSSEEYADSPVAIEADEWEVESESFSSTERTISSWSIYDVGRWINNRVTGTGSGAWILSPETYKDLGGLGKMYTIIGGPGVTRPEDGNAVRIVFIDTSSRSDALAKEKLLKSSLSDGESRAVVGATGNLIFFYHLDKNLGDNYVSTYTQKSNIDSLYYKLP